MDTIQCLISFQGPSELQQVIQFYEDTAKYKKTWLDNKDLRELNHLIADRYKLVRNLWMMLGPFRFTHNLFYNNSKC